MFIFLTQILLSTIRSLDFKNPAASTHAEECILSLINGTCYMQKMFCNIIPLIKPHTQNLNRSTGYRNFIIKAGLILYARETFLKNFMQTDIMQIEHKIPI